MASYHSLGIKRVVNLAGFDSRLGSSCLCPEVTEAMSEAAKWFVDMRELNTRCGETIAHLTGAEAGLITAGAASGLLLATAACITRGDRALMLEMPEAANGAEVIIQKGQRTGYDQAVRTAGAKFVEIGSPYPMSAEQIEEAINDRTVAILFTIGELVSQGEAVPLEKVIDIGKRRGVPVIVDAAVANYPLSRLQSFAAAGADLVVTSGGKHIGGPPSTGFLFGRKDLVDACRLQAGPEYGIGRATKVGKEEMIGLITALELYSARDHRSDCDRWESIVQSWIQGLAELPHVEVSRSFPDSVGRPVPRVMIRVDEKALGVTAREIAALLGQGDPSIRATWLYLDDGIVGLNPVGLLEGDEEFVIPGFRQVWAQLPRASHTGLDPASYDQPRAD